MFDSKKKFNELVQKIEDLKISRKSKDDIINTLCDLVTSFQSDILKRQSELEDKVSNIEEYLSDEYNMEDYEYMIKCPYCSANINIILSDKKMDIKCPKCENIIEVELNKNK